VDAGVAAAVLAASLLHATWHALVKSSSDGVVALAGMNLVSAAVALAVLPLVRLPSGTVWAVIAASVLLHSTYKIALARLYKRADLSQGYPLARGITPVFATVLAFVFLREAPAGTTLAGIAAISAGIACLTLERGAGRLSPAALVAAMAVGLSVAAYSVLDAYGVRLNGDWLGFTAWLVVCDSGAFLAYTFATRGRAPLAQWRNAAGRTLASGVLGITSFCVLMWALGRAPAGAVVALRETSIIFAAAIGAAFLKERMSWNRAVAAAVVIGGAAVIAA
jgi:drug/metabolite transporter (DMT)-like permease